MTVHIKYYLEITLQRLFDFLTAIKLSQSFNPLSYTFSSKPQILFEHNLSKYSKPRKMW